MASFFALCNRCSARVRFMRPPDESQPIFCSACEVERLGDVPQPPPVRARKA